MLCRKNVIITRNRIHFTTMR